MKIIQHTSNIWEFGNIKRMIITEMIDHFKKYQRKYGDDEALYFWKTGKQLVDDELTPSYEEVKHLKRINVMMMHPNGIITD